MMNIPVSSGIGKLLAWSGGGAALGTSLHLLLQAIAPAVSLGGIVQAALSGAMVFLFTLFIKQNGRVAALDATAARKEDVASLKAYAERNKGDLDRLDAESRTVDKRIETSRHLGAQTTTVRFIETEERLVKRLDDLAVLVAQVNEKLQRHLEGTHPPGA